jgi:hypothetical protein
MLLRQLLTASIVSTSVAGCASSPPAASAPQPQTERTVSGYPTIKRWTATLSPTQSYNATAVSSQRQNAYGKVELTVQATTPTLTDVRLVVTVPPQPGLDIVGWGLSQGRCGSGSPAVLPPSAFQPIQLSSNGRGNVDAKIPFVIESGDYHVNVFRGPGTQLSDVITCGDLHRDG